MSKHRSDRFKEIKKRHEESKELGILTNGWQRRGAYSEQDVDELNEDLKEIWSRIISALERSRMIHDEKFSEDMLLLGLSIADIKTVAKDMAITLENQSRLGLDEDDTRENIVAGRVRNAMVNRIKSIGRVKTPRKIAKDKIKQIKEYQEAGSKGIVHPLTCGNDSSHDLLSPMFNSDNEVALICWDCDYVQKHIPPVVLDERFLKKAIKNHEALRQ